MTPPFYQRCAIAALLGQCCILLAASGQPKLNTARDEILEQTRKLIAPSHLALSLLTRVDFAGLETTERRFNESYPFPEGAVLHVSSSYGEIRVTTWNERVVRVMATIRAGASDAATAQQLADGITVQVANGQGTVRVQSMYPDTRAMGRVGYEINYSITVPHDVALVVDNTFGDTYIQGVSGALTLDARYGIVDLRRLSGPTSVRAQGEFPLLVKGLSAGGAFSLRSTLALFEDISGEVMISNHLGRTEVTGIGENAVVDIRSESAQAHVYLPADGNTDLIATALFGAIESAVPVQRSVQGNTASARAAHPESSRHVSVHTSFDTLYLYEEGSTNKTTDLESSKGQLFRNTDLSQTYPLAAGTEILVNAIVGDIVVEGTDEDHVHVTVEKIARLESSEKTQFAMEAMSLVAEEKDGRLTITSRLLEDMNALGCYAYRMNLKIECPRNATIVVKGSDGITTVVGMAGTTSVEQSVGVIRAERTKGKLTLTNHKGDIHANDTAGPIHAIVENGTVNIRKSHGPIEVDGLNARAIVDGPHDKVTIRMSRGDVVILAVEGIGSDYTVDVDEGNISILIPPESDAEIWAHVKGGIVYSSIPLSGNIEGDEQKFHGKVGAGSHKVTLTAKGGNVVIN